MEIELWQMALLVAVGIASGFLNVVAGGGGLLTVPTMVFNIYREGFNFFRMGNATAQAVVLTLIVMILTLVYSQLQKRWGHH